MHARLAIALMVSFSCVATGWSQAPANDGFGARQVIPQALPQTISSSTVNATSEFEEPNHASGHGPNVASNSVWFEWTAAADGFVLFETSGAAFDLAIAIYTGTAIDALTVVGFADLNFDGDEDAAVEVSAGITYVIAVDGYTPVAHLVVETGVFDLVVSELEVATNDDFANARILPSELNVFRDDGRTIGATAEPGEPQHAGQMASHSVWYRWTAPADTLVGIDADMLVDFGETSGFDGAVAVYTGVSLGTLVEVSSSVRTDRMAPERAVFEASLGVEYRIAVDGIAPAAQGRFLLEVLEVPRNDTLAGSVFLDPQFPSTVAGTTVNASSDFDTGEVDHAFGVAQNLSSNSVFYVLVPESTGGVRVSIDAPDFNSVLAVYAGIVAAPFEVAAADAGEGGAAESLVFFAEAGTRYAIVVDARSFDHYREPGGEFILTLTTAPPYDSWISRYRSLTGGATAPDASPAGDGVSNLVKLVLGLDPRVPLGDDPNRANFPQLIDIAGAPTLRYTVAEENLGTGPGQIQHRAQLSSDMATWDDAAADEMPDGVWRVTIPTGAGDQRYGRLSVEIPE